MFSILGGWIRLLQLESEPGDGKRSPGGVGTSRVAALLGQSEFLGRGRNPGPGRSMPQGPTS